MGAIDLKSNIGLARIATYAQKNATVAVAGTEVAGFHGACFVLEVGAHTADGITVTYQDSDDNSTWADIPAAKLDFSTGASQDMALTADNDNATYYIGYKGSKRYIGAKITDAGSGDIILGIYVVKGYAKDIPQNS